MQHICYANYGEDRVKLTWTPGGDLPPVELTTSVHGFCFYRGKLVLVKLKRGYDNPGGHMEPGETPEECFRREALEEAYVKGTACTMLGAVEVSHEENPNWKPGGPYPKVGYQVMYRMEVSELLPFQGEYESSERVVVDPEEAVRLWHGWSGFGQLMFDQALGVKRIYLVRHCKAEGQPPEAPLTAEGHEQARVLAELLDGVGVERIIASPFVRTQQTAAPLAERLGLPIETDDRLMERTLAAGALPDWLEKLKATFDDLDLCLEGGESSRTAMNRAVAAVTDLLNSRATTSVVVSHGNLSALLLKHFDNRIGFEDWKQMTNPDVFLITLTPSYTSVKRVWAK